MSSFVAHKFTVLKNSMCITCPSLWWEDALLQQALLYWHSHPTAACALSPLSWKTMLCCMSSLWSAHSLQRMFPQQQCQQRRWECHSQVVPGEWQSGANANEFAQRLHWRETILEIKCPVRTAALESFPELKCPWQGLGVVSLSSCELRDNGKEARRVNHSEFPWCDSNKWV